MSENLPGIDISIQTADAHYKSLVESISGVILERDFGTLDIKYINGEAQELLGCSSDEQAGFLCWPDYIHPSDKSYVLQTIKELSRNNSRFSLEYRVIRPDDTVLWVRERCRVIAAGNKEPGVISLITDISAEKEMLLKLQSNERLLAEAQHLAKVGSFEWDVKSNIVTWSQELYRIYGVKPEEFGATFESFLERIHPEDREEIKQNIYAAFANKSSFVNEERIIRPDGDIRYLQTRGEYILDKEGNIERLLGVCQDITSYKLSAQEIINRERKFRALAETANDAIISANVEQEIIFFNHGAEKIFGYPYQEVLGKPISMLLPEKYLKAHAEGFSAYLVTGKSRVVGKTVELEGKRKDNTIFPIELSLASWETGEGQFFTAMIRDITDRKKAEEELKDTYNRLQQAQKELIHSEKLAALGRFSSGIAHEIRNPLANISASAQYSLRKFKTESSQKQHLEIILRNTETADRIIKELLDFASPRDITLREGSVVKVIDHVCRLVEPRCRENNIELVKENSTELPLVTLSEEKLEEAFFNFISNAIDAMPSGGKLTVSVSLKKDFIIVSFKDTGIGIPREILDNIVEPFFTTKSNGTGLGLSLAHRIISAHSGSLNIKSEEGKGTTVEVTLPIMTKKENIKR